MFSFKTRLFFLKIIARSLILEIIIQPKANFKSTFFGGFLCTRLDKFRKQPVCPFQPCAIMTKKASFLTWKEKAMSENSAIRNWKKSRSGLEIKDIRQFFQWVSEGSSTYEKRRELFINQKKVIQQEIESLKKTMAMLEFKCWYYDKALQDGNENELHQMLPDKLPEEIQKIYDKAHE
jgi:hypothetical protein